MTTWLCWIQIQSALQTHINVMTLIFPTLWFGNAVISGMPWHSNNLLILICGHSNILCFCLAVFAQVLIIVIGRCIIKNVAAILYNTSWHDGLLEVHSSFPLDCSKLHDNVEWNSKMQNCKVDGTMDCKGTILYYCYETFFIYDWHRLTSMPFARVKIMQHTVLYSKQS